MNRLIDTFTELSIDPFFQDAFACDPEGVRRAAGLTERDREALEALQSGTWARGAAFFDPGPDPLPDEVHGSVHS